MIVQNPFCLFPACNEKTSPTFSLWSHSFGPYYTYKYPVRQEAPHCFCPPCITFFLSGSAKAFDFKLEQCQSFQMCLLSLRYLAVMFLVKHF